MDAAFGNLLDVAIVLCGLFVAISSICSFLTEQLAVFFQLRGNKLYAGVVNLVFSRTLANAIFAHALVDTSVNNKVGIQQQAGKPNRPSYVDPHVFAIAFWDEIANLVAGFTPPLIRAAAAKTAADTSGSPERIAAAEALLSMRNTATANGTGTLPPDAHFEDLRQVVESLPPGPLRTNAMALLATSQPNYDALLTVTGDWFNRQMDRVSGWYNRQSQYIIVGFAALVVLASGIDTLEVAQRLYAAPTMLSAAEQQISGTLSAAPTTDADRAKVANSAFALLKGEPFGRFIHPLFGWNPRGGHDAGNATSDAQVIANIAELSVDEARAKLAEDEVGLQELRANADKEALREKKIRTAFASADESGKAAMKSAVDTAATVTNAAITAATKAVATAKDDANAVQIAADAARSANADLAAVEPPSAHALGWLITFLAAALGAPFWFNVLGKLVNVRGAGPKPQT